MLASGLGKTVPSWLQLISVLQGQIRLHLNSGPDPWHSISDICITQSWRPSYPICPFHSLVWETQEVSYSSFVAKYTYLELSELPIVEMQAWQPQVRAQAGPAPRDLRPL